MSGALDLAALPFHALIGREWLATNQMGGYAASTVPGLNTRKYHGLLVAAMAPPVRRMVLLSRVEETIVSEGIRTDLACNEYPGTIYPRGHEFLRAFSHEPFPRWAYQGTGWTLEKSLRLLRGENTVVITYTMLGGEHPAELELRPLLALRPIHDLTYQWNGRLLTESRPKQHHRVPPTSRTPEVFFAHDGRFEAMPNWYLNTIYRREEERGYAGLEDLWNPGVVRLQLHPGHSAHFVCSADPIDFEKAVKSADRQFAPARRVSASRQGKAAKAPLLAVAADANYETLRNAVEAFVLTLPSEASPESQAACITRYPWSAPSTRDALIAFPGLFLVSSRFAQAKSFLLALAAMLQNGLLPSEFPENGGAPIYHGADISLWFINATCQYFRYTGDDTTLHRRLLDAVLQIISAYRGGTDLGISVDADGLVAARSPGVPTSWMDAKVGDWVITPRAGRPVELNALWYNAIRAAAELARRCGQDARADALTELGDTIHAAFNRRFWNEASHCCFDVIDDHGPDPSVRPNQLLAMSLPFPVLAPERHVTVLEKVRAELLVPLGVRTLSPRDPGYMGHYTGNVVSRDRACHNGSVHPWLLGAYVSASQRVTGRNEASRRQAAELLQPCIDFIRGDGMGQLCELFDGSPPHAPGGALNSAVAVGELLRCYAEDVLDQAPEPHSRAEVTAPVTIPAVVTRPKVKH